jgi:tetratricopeptide (TPR) repeat protein
MLSLELGDRSYDDLTQELSSFKTSGRYTEALTLCDAVLEEDSAPNRLDRSQLNQLTLERINCLVHLARYAAAKDECEDILSNDELKPRQRIVALECFAMCCYRMSKFTFAMMALERAQDELTQAAEIDDAIKIRADLSTLKGNLFAVTGRFQDAVIEFSRAMKEFNAASVPFEACRARINLAYALIELGKFAQARRSLKNALHEAETQGYDRQIALALSHLALLAHREKDFDNAEALCLRSNSVARPREFISVVFRNCYYLWKISLGREDLAGAKIYERSLRHYLNRVEEFLPEAVAFRAYLAENANSTAGGEK